jgi:urate oxidase
MTKFSGSGEGEALLRRQAYGKERVRFLRVVRTPGAHRVSDVTAGLSLEGNFAEAYRTDSNALVVPTDTMKNTLTVLAHDHAGESMENFARQVAAHFLGKYPQVEKLTVKLIEKAWQRAVLAGAPQEHLFLGGMPESTVRLESTRSGERLWGGIRRWELLKTTGSGFAGFPRDEFTTLPDTEDRILATQAEVEWEYADAASGADYEAVRERLLGLGLRVFGEEYSPSVQRTLFRMGEEMLAAVPEIQRVRLSMPNKHYLPLNLSAFGRPAKQDICYLPTDEPHGQIEAELERGRQT